MLEPEDKYIYIYMYEAFEKVQYTFMIKALSKLGIEGNLLKLITNTYET